MSKCNFTQYVSPNLCIGDSLAAFNSNFKKLDEGLCNLPKIAPTPSVRVESTVTPQEDNVLRLGVQQTISMFGNAASKFDSAAGVELVSIDLGDGTSVQTTSFPFISGSDPTTLARNNPTVTISTTIPSNSVIPKLTIYWTASGTQDYTLYNTNSSSSLQINGAVTAILPSSTGSIYLGGDFTSAGNTTNRKFCVLNLTGGLTGQNINYGYSGSILGNPLTAVNEDLGSEGIVNVIKEFQDLIIIGGTFNSLTRGKGLLLFNRVTKDVFPFYINGIVNDIEVGSDGNETVIYVGGTFDFINYGNQSASEVSGLRVYTNGLAKISLTKVLDGFPNSSIDKVFCAAQASLYTGLVAINSIIVRNTALYIGGSFEIRTNSQITAKNIALISVNSDLETDDLGSKYAKGTQILTWKPILNGEVFSLAHDGDVNIYVGGAFTEYYPGSEFYARPRSNSADWKAFGLINFRIISMDGNKIYNPIYQYTWKPQLNGPVTSIVATGEYVYCIGNFSFVENKSVTGSAAFNKSTIDNNPATYVPWNVTTSKNPIRNSNAFAYSLSSFFIGGAFSHANGLSRQSICRVTEANKSFTIANPKPIIWQVGAQLYSYNQPLTLNTTIYTSTSAYAGAWGNINKTELLLNPELFKYSQEGEFARFFIRRAKNTDSFNRDAYVLGWKLDFN